MKGGGGCTQMRHEYVVVSQDLEKLLLLSVSLFRLKTRDRPVRMHGCIISYKYGSRFVCGCSRTTAKWQLLLQVFFGHAMGHVLVPKPRPLCGPRLVFACGGCCSCLRGGLLLLLNGTQVGLRSQQCGVVEGRSNDIRQEGPRVTATK